MAEHNQDDYPHPGELLLTELEELEFSQAGFAKYIGVPTETIQDLCATRIDLTAVLACKIGRALGTAPRKWMEYQINHDLVRVDKAQYQAIRPLGQDPD